MRLIPIVPVALLLAACGSSENPAGKDLSDAANQSDPAAAAVITQAEQAGMNEQQALQAAGNAAVANDQAAAARAARGPVQAVPNTVQTPNRPDGTRPPAKGTGSTSIPAMQMGGEQKQPQPSGGQR